MKMILFAAALALAASPAMAKGKHASKAHHCVDASGGEVKTEKGETIKREKTCKKNKGTWAMKEGGEMKHEAAAEKHEGGEMKHEAAAEKPADAPADKK